MCGIVGVFSPGSTQFSNGAAAMMRPLAAALKHRGPDDEGLWTDPERGIALAHRRLAIVDLSPAGQQPMVSASGRFVIVLNGEIYNHLALRKELQRAGVVPNWRGHSDTETFLAGFDAWGVQNTLERTVGMFAFAVWDRQTSELTLARDRLGEKPLYYGWQGNSFLFGSELKALRAHPDFSAGIDRDALCLFLRHSYIPAPYSIYAGIRKLSPGHLFVVSDRNRAGRFSRYWSGKDAIQSALASPFAGTPEEAVDALERLLLDAIRQQAIADVPLGAFLSGGVDSSTVVALMQSQATEPVRTFSIGFHEGGYDEAKNAEAVAAHLRTDHCQLYVTPQQALEVIPSLPSLYDEPFSDASQIPTFLVSQLARQHVTVSLSGDGGDELFCGYNRYMLGKTIWPSLERIPYAARQIGAATIGAISPHAWDRVLQPVANFLPKRSRITNPGEKMHKAANVMLGSRSAEAFYTALVSHWPDPEMVVIDGHEPETLLTDRTQQPVVPSLPERMMALDMLSYLPDDILVKVDRAAMAVGLETRVPFLDHRVVEFAWRLPLDFKLRDGQSKWVLRQVLHRHVPPGLIERPKMGFGVPLANWLRGPLRGWGENLLDESRLKSEGFFKPTPIQEKWKEHLSGKRDWGTHLWDVLVFQAWLERTHAG